MHKFPFLKIDIGIVKCKEGFFDIRSYRHPRLRLHPEIKERSSATLSHSLPATLFRSVQRQKIIARYDVLLVTKLCVPVRDLQNASASTVVNSVTDMARPLHLQLANPSGYVSLSHCNEVI